MKKILLICNDISRNRKVIYDQNDLLRPLNGELTFGLHWSFEDHQIVLSCWKNLPLDLSRIIMDDIIWYYFYHRLYDQVLEILLAEKDGFTRFLKKFKGRIYQDDDIFLQVGNILNLYKCLDEGLSLYIDKRDYLTPARISFTCKSLSGFYSIDFFSLEEKIFLQNVGRDYNVISLGDLVYDCCIIKGNSLRGYIHTDFFYHPVLIFTLEEFNPFDEKIDIENSEDLFRNWNEIPTSIKTFFQSLIYLYGKNTGVFLMLKDKFFGQVMININNI